MRRRRKETTASRSRVKASVVLWQLRNPRRSLRSRQSVLFWMQTRWSSAAGGGGIPVLKQGMELKGASAIIEKDYASGRLAEMVDADIMLDPHER